MGLVDIAVTAGGTFFDLEKLINECTAGSISIYESMPGNNGQDTITERYIANCPPYISSAIYSLGAEHDWAMYLNEIGSDSSESAIEGTIIILGVVFDYITAYVLMGRAIAAQAALETLLMGGGDSGPSGDGGGGILGLKRKANNIKNRSTGGSWDRQNGIPSNWRHSKPGGAFRDEDLKDTESFYKRLSSPGLPGLRARFQAGGSDQQMALFVDNKNLIPQPKSITITAGPKKGQTLTMIPNHHRWSSNSNANGVWFSDPGGSKYQQAMSQWDSMIAKGEKTYQLGSKGYDQFGKKRPEMQNYNPYTMQKQQARGEYPSNMTWEGKTVPYGLGSR